MNKEHIELGQWTAAYTQIGKGPAMIFIHGLFGDGWTLHPIMNELQEQYTCIGIDLLGFGASSKPRSNYIVDRQVEYLTQFLQAKQITECYFLGYSYGAWVASAFAISHAQSMETSTDIKGMALVAPAGIRDDSFNGRYQYLRPLLWETSFVDWVLKGLKPIAVLSGKQKYFGEICNARQAIMTQPAAKTYLMERLKPEAAIDTVEDELHFIKTPTLVIAGEQDPHIPMWHSQTYAERIPQATLEILPGAAHDLVQTHGPEIANLIKTRGKQN